MRKIRGTKQWLTQRATPEDREWPRAVEELHPDFEQGDELWHAAAPVPPEFDAGEVGIALVRDGKPIHSMMTGVH